MLIGQFWSLNGGVHHGRALLRFIHGRLDHVTFTAVVEELYFTMFTDRCQGSGMCAVDVYKCAGERAFDVANAIGDAFKLSDAVAKEDPFKPSSSGGERSPA